MIMIKIKLEKGDFYEKDMGKIRASFVRMFNIYF